jgi:hypothetical protein
VQIAAEHSEAISQRTWVGVKKRLLLDRIALDAADISPGYVEGSAAIVAYLADSGLAFGDWATMTTGITAYPVAVEFLVKFAFAHVLVDDIAKGSHDPGPLLTFYPQYQTSNVKRRDRLRLNPSMGALSASTAQD